MVVHSGPQHAVRAPRRVHRQVPAEVWHMVCQHLGRRDLLRLAQVCRYLSAVAERDIYRDVTLTAPFVTSWGGAVMLHHRADAVRSLSVSLAGPKGVARRVDVLFRLASAVCQLPNLRELKVKDARIPREFCRDLVGSDSCRLEKFYCDCDELVLASWPSLSRQHSLQEFRGLYGVLALPPTVAPSAFPELRVLATGPTFASRISSGCKVSRLSIHAPRMTAASIVKRITEVLGDHLVTLKVVRTILCPRSAGNNWGIDLAGPAGAMPGAIPYWESDSPVVLCAALSAPRLRYFEVRDRVHTPGTSWSVGFDTLRERPSFGPAFKEAQRTSRTPSLSTLLWRPVWAGASKALRSIVFDHVMDAFSLLPVSYVGMPLVEHVSGLTAAPNAEGWSTWAKAGLGENAPARPPPAWWEGPGTVEQASGYVCMDELWVTF
ncbi:hypothetical protein C8Q77DRAFT_1059327 [Trametes polyzona]|nr:hypothetical protein C8Q77DRAFT_1059327 [Trametes polyzona]